MKSIISVNYKFMNISPKKLVEMIKASKSTKGIELYIDYKNDKELNYLDNLIFELKRNKLLLQIHGNVELDINDQISYIKLLEGYADDLGYPIVFTMHTINDDDIDESLERTVDYIYNLKKCVDSKKIILCLENLNCIRGYERADKNKIEEIVLNDEELYFTYDIGHEIADYGEIINLSNYMIQDIRNVHIHSNDVRGIDHMPIYKDDVYWNEIMKGLSFLIVNNYQGNIVYEYGLEYCQGETLEDKINDYLMSIDLVSEKYLNVLDK